MAFVAVSTDGNIMPQFTIPYNLRLNPEISIDTLEEVVLPLIEDEAFSAPYI